MNSAPLLLVSAAVLSSALALAVLFRGRASLPRWSFAAGMLILAGESLCAFAATRAPTAEAVEFWHGAMLALRTFIPAVWLAFSLTFSRGEYRDYLVR
jgi:hypothetical protein